MNWMKDPHGGAKGLPAWDSDCGNFRVIDCRSMRSYKPYRLVDLREKPHGGVEFFDFFTLHDAKQHAERI